MKKAIFCAIFVLLAVPAWGQSYETVYPAAPVYDIEGESRDHQKLSTMTSATALAADKVNKDGYGAAMAVLLSVETAAARCAWHGSDPVVTGASQVGHLFNAGDSYVIRGVGNVGRLKCINAVNANGAVIMVTFYYAE